MSLSSDVIEHLPRVEGLLNYLAPMTEKPMNLTYDPPPGMPRSTGVPEPHVMRIHDARPIAGRLTLDGEGLAIVEHRSAVEDFYDEDELRRGPCQVYVLSTRNGCIRYTRLLGFRPLI